jgi:putative transposase
VSARTHDGRSVRILNLINEYSRECLLIRPNGAGVRQRSTALMVWQGVPEHIRSDNGPEFVAKDFRKWLARQQQNTVDRTRLSPGERLLRELNSKLRDEFLNGEIFSSIKELRVLGERWRVHYNTVRPEGLPLLLDRAYEGD